MIGTEKWGSQASEPHQNTREWGPECGGERELQAQGAEVVGGGCSWALVSLWVTWPNRPSGLQVPREVSFSLPFGVSGLILWGSPTLTYC